MVPVFPTTIGCVPANASIGIAILIFLLLSVFGLYVPTLTLFFCMVRVGIFAKLDNGILLGKSAVPTYPHPCDIPSGLTLINWFANPSSPFNSNASTIFILSVNISLTPSIVLKALFSTDIIY